MAHRAKQAVPQVTTNNRDVWAYNERPFIFKGEKTPENNKGALATEEESSPF